jgi:hypothetical protein
MPTCIITKNVYYLFLKFKIYSTNSIFMIEKLAFFLFIFYKKMLESLNIKTITHQKNTGTVANSIEIN